MIYDPLANELFFAEQGRGAWCNGERLKTSSVTSVGEALVAVSLPPRVGPETPDLADFIRMVQYSQAVRRSGSAALNLAYVAHGRLDAFWATKIQPWDVAAGVLLVREAGGIVTGRHGGEFDVWSPHFVSAAGAELHGELMRVLGPAKRLVQFAWIAARYCGLRRGDRMSGREPPGSGSMFVVILLLLPARPWQPSRSQPSSEAMTPSPAHDSDCDGRRPAHRRLAKHRARAEPPPPEEPPKIEGRSNTSVRIPTSCSMPRADRSRCSA